METFLPRRAISPVRDSPFETNQSSIHRSAGIGGIVKQLARRGCGVVSLEQLGGAVKQLLLLNWLLYTTS